MQLEAASYTMEWGLAPVSQSFLNLDTTYRQVMDKILKNQKDAEILDCATKGAVIPDFLLQYERATGISSCVLPVIFIPLWYRTAVRRMDGPILEFRIWGRICPER